MSTNDSAEKGRNRQCQQSVAVENGIIGDGGNEGWETLGNGKTAGLGIAANDQGREHIKREFANIEGGPMDRRYYIRPDTPR